ncbi:MAG: putative dynein heavy chain [Streblomastix strix]|uniref:Putative dynein heavy chain n=1 Tax=Streblomastix strix TaxID=222440 RepID=A0A5J4TWW8_9EUKA|nr:MAG: putative dynein heavy chain [Streblomastix strix]
MGAINWSHWRVEQKEAEFEELDAISMEQQLTKAISNMARYQKLFRETPEPLSVAQLVKGQIGELAPRIPMIVALRNPGMKDRHWKQLEEVCKQDIIPKKGTTLNDMLNLDIQDHKGVVMKICDIAAKEYAFEEALIEIEKE